MSQTMPVKDMQTNSDNSVIIQKTRELCQTILDQPDFQAIRQRIASFEADHQAQALLQSLNEKRESLERKQEDGTPLTKSEIAEFEQRRDAFLGHPVASAYMDAQQEMHDLRKTVNTYLTRTLELGRLPLAADLESASCGNGCGCH
jgi:cell fate (sporulation/competence/biofilm development) regulator YlbF (YheA/YmcA/DUF963 family)